MSESHIQHNHRDHDQEHSEHEHTHSTHTKGIFFFLSLIAHRHSDAGIIESSIVTTSKGMRALVISVIGLGITAGVQILVVSLSGSVALLTDSIHNIADALTALPLGVAFLLGNKKPNKKYTYGYGRAEDLAGIFIIILISASSIIALSEAISRLANPQPIKEIPLVIGAGLVGFIGNEIVAIYRIKIGKRIGSAALTADGLHARSDGLASLAVVVGAIGVALGFKQADPIASLLIGIAVFAVLRHAALEIYRRLMDSIDPSLVDQVTQILLDTPGVEAIQAVHIRWIGHQLRAEIGIYSRLDLTLIESHDISEEAHHNLLHRIPRLSEAVIHTSPYDGQADIGHDRISHHFLEND